MKEISFTTVEMGEHTIKMVKDSLYVIGPAEVFGLRQHQLESGEYLDLLVAEGKITEEEKATTKIINRGTIRLSIDGTKALLELNPKYFLDADLNRDDVNSFTEEQAQAYLKENKSEWEEPIEEE